MSERKNMVLLAGFVLSVSLIAASLTVCFLTEYYRKVQFRDLGDICQGIVEEEPRAKTAVLTVLKEYYNGESEKRDGENILLVHGYGENGFPGREGVQGGVLGRILGIIGFLAGGALFLGTLLFWHKKNGNRIRQLTEYLEKVNTGGDCDLFQVGEDDFSKLQDEIYKTVTQLRQTREEALRAKKNFAENLYNIAHQIKTPITAISLSAQMMKENPSGKQAERIEKQLSRLTYLEEALLLLSRIEAGTLTFDRKKTDVFTVLMLAADNLQTLSGEAGVSIEVPELGECAIYADLDWTMEAVINLFRNCLEHTPPGGRVRCSYEQNLLYTKIRIWDTGSGFEKEDIPHLFERFYRGKNAKKGGIGIGLALSRAIIEGQNGTVTARNLPEGGACFELHFYSH